MRPALECAQLGDLQENKMKTAYFALSLLVLAGCGGGGGTKEAAFEPGSCDAVRSVLAAGQETVPYSSLRGEPKMQGERVLNDTWIAKSPAFGEHCEIGVISGMMGTDISLYRCELFTALRSSDRETTEAEARALMSDVSDTIKGCLGDEWVAEETTEHDDFEVYQNFVFEPVSGRPGADTFDFTVDPIFLKMSYTPYMRGRSGPSGWIVELQFQEQRAVAE